MAGGVFLIQKDGQLVEMSEESYGSEADFQELLANIQIFSPEIRLTRKNPRRWLLISREAALPSEENGSDRWSVDHLFLDQDAIPTLVEVKRSSDTRIRREVVGQMLEYAANAVVYWPVEEIRAKFDATCQAKASIRRRHWKPFWVLRKIRRPSGKRQRRTCKQGKYACCLWQMKYLKSCGA